MPIWGLKSIWHLAGETFLKADGCAQSDAEGSTAPCLWYLSGSLCLSPLAVSMGNGHGGGPVPIFKCPARPVGLQPTNNHLMACLSPILPAAGWEAMVFHEGVWRAALWAEAVVHHLL